MSITIPSGFLPRVKLPVDWDDIAWAYDNGLIDSQTVIDYACDEISRENTECQAVLELACARAPDSLAEPLSRVTGPDFASGKSTKKWALLLAAYIAERDDVDQLSEIEDVYSSYDYPSELSPFVRYMPMTGPDLGSRSANEQRMINALKEFAKTIVGSEEAAES
jgi:hypothetical protein